jgi:hypothetical protein
LIIRYRPGHLAVANCRKANQYGLRTSEDLEVVSELMTHLLKVSHSLTITADMGVIAAGYGRVSKGTKFKAQLLVRLIKTNRLPPARSNKNKATFFSISTR